MRGINRLTMFTRKVVFVKGSRLDLRAPSLSQTFKKTPPPCTDGDDGKHGVNGPIGIIIGCG